MRRFGAAAWSRLPLKPWPTWLLVTIGAGLVIVDYATGPYFQFPSVYILLIIMVAWSNGAVAGVSLAILLPLTRVALMEFYWNAPWDPIAYAGTAVARMSVWSALAFMAARLADHERLLRTQVATLISLLPVCGECQKIRGDDDAWEPLAVHAAKHSSQFSQGLCPSCLRARMPEHIAPE